MGQEGEVVAVEVVVNIVVGGEDEVEESRK